MKDDPRRLWDRAERVGECLEWRGAKTKFDGYGLLMWGGERRRRAHRVSYELTNGPVPSGLHVLHKCDNPPCIEPSHLFVGTQTDNMRDKAAKGRAVGKKWTDQKGSGNRNAKLSEQSVLAIRSLASNGIEYALLAQAFGVTRGAISLVVKRKLWTHV